MTARMQCRYKRSWLWRQGSCIEAGDTQTHTRAQEDMGDEAAESGVATIAACYQGFDPSAYLQYNYTPPRADFQRKDSIVPWKLACLHRAFTEGEEESRFCSPSALLTSGVLFFLSLRRRRRGVAGGRGLRPNPVSGAEWL